MSPARAEAAVSGHIVQLINYRRRPGVHRTCDSAYATLSGGGVAMRSSRYSSNGLQCNNDSMQGRRRRASGKQTRRSSRRQSRRPSSVALVTPSCFRAVFWM